MMYETFAHTADLGLRVTAGSWEELFAEAGRGLLAMLVANPQQVRPVEEAAIRVDGDGEPSADQADEMLLFDWLNELLYRFESEGLLLSEFSVPSPKRRADGRLPGRTDGPGAARNGPRSQGDHLPRLETGSDAGRAGWRK